MDYNSYYKLSYRISELDDEKIDCSQTSFRKMVLSDIQLPEENIWIPNNKDKNLLATMCPSILNNVKEQRGSFFYNILFKECQA